jgi:uncharacterized membrane protein
MLLKTLDLISIVLTALVLGVYWGPWLALSRSFRCFEAEVFLPVVHQMDRNLSTPMTALTPPAVLSILPVLAVSLHQHRQSFTLTLIGLLCLIATVLVTVVIEVPIVEQFRGWTLATLPAGWQELRDRWVRFHLLRVAGGLAALIFLLAGTLT